MKHLITAAAILLAGLAHAALANDTVTYEVTDQSYDDVMFGLENAILDFGLVISEHNHVGDMLERTKADLEIARIIPTLPGRAQRLEAMKKQKELEDKKDKERAAKMVAAKSGGGGGAGGGGGSGTGGGSSKKKGKKKR